VPRVPNRTAAAERARWLAELSEAIVQAQRLTWNLGIINGDNREARDLYGRLEAVRTEAESLRLGDWSGSHEEIDPQWICGLDGHMLPKAPGS